MFSLRRKPSPWLPQGYHWWPDRDRDGISDHLEEELLRRFRPYYKFSRLTVEDTFGYTVLEEQYRPTDPIWDQMVHSCLRVDEYHEGGTSDVVQLGTVGNVIDPSRFLFSCGGMIDVLNNPQRTSYAIDLNDDYRAGRDWHSVMRDAPGLYGHVAPAGNTGNINIEYWQFFAYSVWQGVGDHEADWDTVRICYDPRSDKLVNVSHYHHGDDTTFVFSNRRVHRTVRRDFAADDGVRFLEYYNEYHDDSFDEDNPNDIVRFYVDDDGHEHVVVYIERGSHEFWPTERGSALGAGEHNGLGQSYLTAYNPASPLNLGEVEHPLSDDAKIIMRFNGWWGCWHWAAGYNPPPGPTFHREWTWPRSERALQRSIPSGDIES